jgi:hypothetical protein
VAGCAPRLVELEKDRSSFRLFQKVTLIDGQDLVAVVLGESLSPIKLLGCSIGIDGVFLYSIIDNIVKKKD